MCDNFTKSIGGSFNAEIPKNLPGYTVFYVAIVGVLSLPYLSPPYLPRALRILLPQSTLGAVKVWLTLR